MNSSDASLRGDLVADTRVRSLGDGRYAGEISPAWKIFRACGGVIFAVALRAVDAELGDPSMQPLSASVMFSSGMDCGPVEVRARVVRRGSGSAFAVAELYREQQAPPVAMLHSVFGAKRASAIVVERAVFPEDVEPPEKCVCEEGPLASVPIMRQHEWRRQQLAGEAGYGRTLSWMRYHVPPRRADGLMDLITYPLTADILAPAIFSALQPAAYFNLLTMQMNIQFFGETRQDWFLQVTRVLRARDGYAYGTVELWSEDKTLLAVASQRAICTDWRA